MRELAVVINSTCPLECAHCCTNSGPNRKDRLRLSQFERVFGSLAVSGQFKSVVFTGGEPTLLGKDLCSAIAMCKKGGWTTRLVTSASWATTPKRAKDLLDQLSNAGLDEISFSWDDAHEDFVPIDRLKRAWIAAKSYTFSVVTIANTHGPKSKWTPVTIQAALGERIPILRGDAEGFKQFATSQHATRYGIVNQHLQRIGRGAKGVPREAVGRRDARDPMDLTCPSSIENPALSAKGHLVACGGMELDGNPFLDFGDVTARDAAIVYSEAHKNIVAQAIRYLGPGAVMTFVAHEEGEDVGGNDFISICEICQDLTSKPKWIALLRKHQHKLIPHIIAAAKRKNDHATVDALMSLPSATLPLVDAFRPIPKAEASPLFG